MQENITSNVQNNFHSQNKDKIYQRNQILTVSSVEITFDGVVSKIKLADPSSSFPLISPSS